MFSSTTSLGFGLSHGPYFTLPSLRIPPVGSAGPGRPQIDGTIAMTRAPQTIGLGGELDLQPAIVELFSHAAIGPEHPHKAGIGDDERTVFPQHEAIAAAPFDRGQALVEMILLADIAARHLPEQARPTNRMRAKLLDAVEVQFDLVTAAAESNGGVARIRGPDGVIGVGAAVEIVVHADLVKRNDLAVVGLGHQPDVKVHVTEVTLAVGRQRHALVRRQPVADDAVLALGVFVVAGRARRNGGEREQQSERGKRASHAGMSIRAARRFSSRAAWSWVFHQGE